MNAPDAGSWGRTARLRLRSWLRRAAVERELDEELAYHLAQLEDTHAAAGLSGAAARAAAVRQLGGLVHAKEAVRDTWHVRIVDQLRQDVRIALRGMRRAPGATLVMLLTLAVGIGASTAVFSLVNGVLLRAPYPDADRIVWLISKTPRGERSAVSALDYRDWQRENSVFEALASWGFGSGTLSDDVVPVPMRITFAAPAYFDVLGLRPELGRGFLAEEETTGKDRVVILSHQLWTSRFQGAPDIVGRTIRVRGEPHVVVGVMPESASRGDWSWTELWLPHVIGGEAGLREYRSFNVYGRLRDGVSLDAARTQMNALASRLGQTYPDADRGWGIELAPYTEVQASPAMRRSLYLLLAAVGAVLLIACVNLANMLLARSLARRQESSIRAALGGGRGRLLRQYATESLLLSLTGGALGLVTAEGLLRVARTMLPAFASANAPLPPANLMTIDARVLAFALSVSVATSLLFGLLPAWAAARIDLASAMKERRAGGAGARGPRRALVVAEVALAFVLLTSASLMLRSVNALAHQARGFDAANVLTASLPLTVERVRGSADERRAYLQQVLNQVSLVPGVRSAALTSALPMQGWGSELPCLPGHWAAVDRASRPLCFFKMVSSGYFNTLALQFEAGRGFTDADDAAGARLAVINETMARKYFGATNPIGQRVVVPELIATGRTTLGADVAWQIVGVVADERVSPLTESRESPGLYVSLGQSPTRRPSLVMRTELQPSAIERGVRRAVAGVNHEQPLADVRTLEAIKDAALGSDRQRSVVLSAFALVSLLLSAIGIYGVLSYTVTERTRELGVRAAVGAGSRHLLAVIFKDGLGAAAVGLGLGLVAVVALSRLWAGLLYGVSPLDAFSLAQAAVAVMAVATIACAFPARRAVSIDPLRALRCD